MTRHHYVGPTLLLATWGGVAGFGLVDPFFLPGPLETFTKITELISEQVILPDILATLGRILSAFAISTCIGVPLGLLLGQSERVYRSIEFVVDFFRSTPALALFPLFLILFGVGDASKIAVAAFSATILIVFNVAYGLMHSRKSRLVAAKLMGANNLQRFVHILFWESLPQTFVGLRNSMSWIIAIIIVTEMFVGTQSGLGHKIIDYQITYDVPGVYAAILIAGVLGYLINLLLAITDRRMIHWAHR